MSQGKGSLADQAVAVLAKLSALESPSINQPERHAIRRIKQMAAQRLSQAFDEAEGMLALIEEVEDLVAALKQTNPPPPDNAGA